MREFLSVIGEVLLVLTGGVLLAVVMYFAVVIGALLIGALVLVLLARAAARFIP